MRDKAEECCEIWEEVPRDSIRHSRLYDLEPMSVGSPMVESLTGYIARLADAHSVSPATLVIREILPSVAPSEVHQDGKWVYKQLSSVFRASALLNGVSEGTQSWVLALEELTGRGDLRFLTLLTFSKVLPPRSLLRRTRAWCPLCYQRWWQAGLVVYEPLIWSMECVRVCGHHHLPLSHRCPYPDCARVLRPLEPNMIVGYCPKCHRWMGQARGLTRPVEPPADEEWQWQLWVEQTVGELLATGPHLVVIPSRERIAAHLTTYLDAFLDGRKTELVQRLNSNLSSIRDWLAGKQLPHLGNLLRICFLFQTTLVGFFTENARERTLSLQAVPQTSVAGGRTRRRLRRFDTNGIHLALVKVLQEDPPPTMRQVAKLLGYDPSDVYKHFPDLCQAISRRYQMEQANRSVIRWQRDREELREAMHKLTSQGVYPSQRQLQKVLSKPGVFRDIRIRAAWHEVLQELGYKP
jgi:hypothetical protein